MLPGKILSSFWKGVVIEGNKQEFIKLFYFMKLMEKHGGVPTSFSGDIKSK